MVFLKATAFPIATHGCDSWVMISGDKKRVSLLRVLRVERKTNTWVLDNIGSGLDVDREYG